MHGKPVFLWQSGGLDDLSLESPEPDQAMIG